MAGTLTVLFTDLVGSTELLAQLGDDAMQAVRRRHFAVLGDGVAAHRGGVVKSLGDGIMAVFASATDAVSCAVTLQRAVTPTRTVLARPHTDATLAMRIGLSAGEPILEDGDYHGTPVVEAARLCAASRGGQILVSEIVRLLVGARGGFAFNSVGLLQLKGLPQPVTSYEVQWEPDTPAAILPLPGQLSTRGQPAFAARSTERGLLTAQWQAAAAGERRIVLIAGEPGIGKTRLAAELAGEAHTAGALVMAGRCDEDTGVPYAPFGEAVRPLIEVLPLDLLQAHIERYGGDLARLLPELRRRVPTLPEPRSADAESERWCLFEAAVSVLANASTSMAPALLVLDDLHWAGKPALLLLRHLARSPEPMALLVVATYRDTDLARTHPLTTMLADLRREPGVERLALRGLDAEGVLALVEVAAGTELGEPGRALAAAIARETEGNPFFVQEILRHLVETGAVRRDADGRWALDVRVDQLAIPEGIREVVGRRLSRLSETANQALGTAAVIGREFDLAVLEGVGEWSGNALLDALDEARRARLLVEEAERPGQYSFTHAMVRQTLLEELGTTRRVRLHLQIGEAIERLAGDQPEQQLSALAHHFSESAVAGGAARAVRYNQMAAERAAAGAAWEEASAHYERALSALDQDRTPDVRARDEMRCDLLTAKSPILFNINDRQGARAAGLAAVDTARRLHDAERLGAAALASYVSVFTFGSIDTVTVELLDEALAALPPGQDALQATLLGHKVTLLETSGNGPDTTALALEALAAAGRSADPRALAAAHVARAWSLIGTPDLGSYRETGEARSQVGWGQRSGASTFLAAAAVRRGDGGEFARQRERQKHDAERLRIPSDRALALQYAAAEALWQGRFDEARRLARSLEALIPGDPGFPAAARDQRMTARIETGRGGELIGDLESIVTAYPSFAYSRATLALLRAESGDRSGARQSFEVLGGDGFVSLPYGFGRPATLHRLAEACVLLGDAERAALLYEIMLPYSGQLLIAFLLQSCLAAADRDLGALAATMGRLVDAERHLLAAEQLEERFGAPPLVARTRLALARVLLQRGGTGDRERARALLDHVVGAAAGMGMAGVEREARALLT